MHDLDGIKMLFGSPKENFDNAIQQLKSVFDVLCDKNKHLSEQLSNWNKDDEIQKAHKEADWYKRNSLITLSDNEVAAIKEFKNRHYNSCHNGSTYQYELTGTGIGTAIKIKCPKCGEEIDITDYSSW